MPILQDISSPCVPLKQNHQIEELLSAKGTLLTSSEEKSRESQVCPICGRTFVYQLNFAKHLAAAGCCQPPCKKSRMDPEPDTKETFKSNTLPRTSRSKKITRSNSTKSRKKQTIPSLKNHLQEYLPNTEIISNFQGAPMMTDSREQENKTLRVTKQRPAYASGPFEAQTLSHSLQESTYCSFCDLQLNSENLYQRHRLAHALVIQLTRCLVHSLPRISSPHNETACGSNLAVLDDWLSDQIRCNINDDNWLKLSVQEVEQVLGNSNMDVDIPQRHGIQDNAGFQNIVDLLVSQDLNLTPASEFVDTTKVSDFIPLETEKSVETTCISTSVTYDPSLIQQVCTMPDQPMVWKLIIANYWYFNDPFSPPIARTFQLAATYWQPKWLIQFARHTELKCQMVPDARLLLTHRISTILIKRRDLSSQLSQILMLWKGKWLAFWRLTNLFHRRVKI